MKITKIYQAIFNGIGLIVEDEEIKTPYDGTVTMQVTGKDGVKKLPMLIPTKESVRKVEPVDIVRFHPLGESVFADISDVNKRFAVLMTSDIYTRITLLGEKLIEVASDKESDINSNIHKLTNGVNVTGVSAKYWKAVVRAGLTKHGLTSLFRLDNLRGKEIDGIKYNRVCQTTSNLFSVTPDVGFFGVKPTNDKHFAMVMLVFKRILGPILMAKGSNLKSSPTFASMLLLLLDVNKNINKMAKALYRSTDNACHRDISWGDEIASLPDLYRKELNVSYKHNSGGNAKIKLKPSKEVVEVEEVQTEPTKNLMSDKLDKPTEEVPANESPKPTILQPDDPLITGVIEQTVAVAAPQIIQQQTAAPAQEQQPMNQLFNDQPLSLAQQGIQVAQPVKRLGMELSSVQANMQANAQVQTQLEAAQVLSTPQGNVAVNSMTTQSGLPMAIVGEATQVKVKREAVDMGENLASERGAVSVKQVNECHAIDAHRQPLFYADGEPYLIKGRNAKVEMIHAQNQQGQWLFGPDGSPVLTPPTMATDGTVKGLKGTGVAGGQRQQAHVQQQQQDPNSLAARLNGGNGQSAIFGNQLGGNGLTQQQILQHQRNGGAIGLGQPELSDADLQKVYEHLKFLVSNNGITLQQGQVVEKQIMARQLTLVTAKKIIQLTTNLRQQLSGLGSQLGGSQLGSQLGGRQGNVAVQDEPVQIGGWE